MDLPCVVEIVGLARRPEVDRGKRHRSLAAFAVAQQEIGEGVPSGGCSQPRRGIRLKSKRAPGELVSDLVVLIPPDLQARPQRVLPGGPGKVIDRLVDVVRVGVGTLGGVAESGEACNSDRREPQAIGGWIAIPGIFSSEITSRILASSVPFELKK